MTMSRRQSFPAETLVWTAGVKPAPLARFSGLPLDERGRIEVDAASGSWACPNVWAAGDIAAVPDLTTGGFTPPTAQHAMRQGKRLGRERDRHARPAAPSSRSSGRTSAGCARSGATREWRTSSA